MNETIHRYLSGVLIALFALLFFALLPKGKKAKIDVARDGVLLSLALVFGLVESFLPDFFIPGMRIGLANIVILLCLLSLSFKESFLIALLKAVLVALLRGSFLSMGGFMALAGTMLSFLGMALLHRLFKRLSPIALSVFGSLLHVMGQLAVAVAYLGLPILGYAPVLLLASFASGALIGVLVLILRKRISFRPRALPE